MTRQLAAFAFVLLLSSVGLVYLLTSTGGTQRYAFLLPQPDTESPELITAAVNVTCTSSTKEVDHDVSIIGRHFAYVQYATTLDYFCNAIINARRLKGLGAEYDIVIMYPEDWIQLPKGKALSRALRNVETKLSYVILKPVSLFSTSRGDSTWKYSLTKFHAFNLSEYDRVLYFDSDTLVINSFDRYFDAPPAPLALPRAYWLCSFEDQGRQWLGSHVMLIQPSPQIFSRILSQIDTAPDFDMEMVNHMFGSSAMILPHRHLALLSGEFRSEDHSKYLAGSDTTEWDPDAEYVNTALIHFSDWPLPKPWKVRSDKQWEEVMPKCGNQEANVSEKQDGSNTTCPDREIWVELYAQYDSENRAVRHLIL